MYISGNVQRWYVNYILYHIFAMNDVYSPNMYSRRNLKFCQTNIYVPKSTVLQGDSSKDMQLTFGFFANVLTQIRNVSSDQGPYCLPYIQQYFKHISR